MICRRWGVVRTALPLLLLVVLSPAAEAAAASRVVLLRAPTDDALIEQGNTLLAAELRAAGFEVTPLMRDPSRDIRSDIEAASTKLGPIATFAIRPASDGAAVELWLEDRVTGKLVIRRIVIDRKREAASDLAVRAIELLRGSLVEVILPSPNARAGSSPPVDVARWVSTAVQARAPYFSSGPGIAAGATALATLGLGMTFAPTARASWGTAGGLVARLSLTAFGPGIELRRPEGSANVRQALLVIEGARAFRSGARFQPLVVASAGFRRMSVDGAGTSSLFAGATGVAYALVISAGGGLAARLSDHVALVLESELLFAAPSTHILIASTDAGLAGGFGWNTTLCAVATF